MQPLRYIPRASTKFSRAFKSHIATGISVAGCTLSGLEVVSR